MKNENEKSISVLNDLIQTAKDGEQGYRAAAERADETELKSLFGQYAEQRAEFARELQLRTTAIGGDAEKSGSLSGAMHRGWLDVKSAVTSNGSHALLAECERGEDVAVKAYRDALDEYVDGATRELVRRQYSQIQATHDRIKQLRDSLQYAEKA